MAASDVTLPTLQQLAKSVDPGWSQILPIVELLSQKHGLHSVLPFKEANTGTGEIASVRTGLPTPTWRMFNRGVPASSSRRAQITFECGILKSLPEVDLELLKIAPNREQFLMQEYDAHVEAIVSEFNSTAWYGTAAAPEEFVGLASMYSDPTASNGRNVIDAGGSDGSDNTSIWFLRVGPNIYGAYPRGSTAGISRSGISNPVWAENFGGTGLRAQVVREELGMAGTVVVRDWRDGVRIGSIDVSNLRAQVNDANLLFYGTAAKHRILSNGTGGRVVALMNSSTAEYLEHQMNDKMVAGGGVTVKTVDGMDVTHFCGFPIVIDDDILNTEAPV